MLGELSWVPGWTRICWHQHPSDSDWLSGILRRNGRIIKLWHFYLVLFSDSQPFRSRASSLPGANRPIELWPIRSMELSLLGPFVPWLTRSWLSRSLELCSQERNGPGTFIPLVHDVMWNSNYTLLLMRTFSIERCGARGLSQTLIRRPCSG